MSAERSDEVIFEAALKLTAGERSAYLDQTCAGDVNLRRRVDDLLGAFERAGGFMNQPAAPERTVKFSPVPPEKPGDRIGRYKLLEQIGEGGCGIVYVAEQQEPVRRRVALKVIKLGMDTKQVIARFDAERQALAMMDHPNIARVLDAGATDTGRPYFVMELVRGIRITDYCGQNHLAIQERLGLFIKVCQAIQHAHQKGIIHRDIKPSNVLVASDDGVPVPKVIDFGIAKATQGRLTDLTVYTAFEQFIGTPAYMSPEQAQMSMQDIDTRSDIYSLGVLLYELLTGTTPFDANELLSKGLDEMRRTIREVEPVKPSTRLTQEVVAADARRLNARSEIEDPKAGARARTISRRLLQEVRGDLDWIVMKCLEKDRTRRYETANSLALDVRRHLGNEPIVARPPGSFYRFQKAVQRNKLAFGFAATVALTLLIGLVVSMEHARTETALRRRAEAAEHESKNQLYQALLEQARATVRSGDLGQRERALEAIRSAAVISNSVDLRGAAVAALALPDLRFEREVPADISAELDPRFERMAVCRGTNATEIRSAVDQRLLATLPASTNAPANVSWWSPDGQFLAVKRDLDSVGSRASLEVWSVSEARQVLQFGSLSWDAVSFHPVLPLILLAGDDGVAHVFDLRQGDEIGRFQLAGTVLGVQFAPDGRRLAVRGKMSDGWQVSVHNSADGSLLASNRFGGEPMALAWDPAGDQLAVADLTGEIHLMNGKTGEVLLLGRHKAQAATAVFSSDGAYLFTGGWERECICWDTHTRRRAIDISLDSFRLQFRGDGRACALRTSSGMLKFYTFDRPAHREFSEDLGVLVRRAVFSADGRWLAASGDHRLGLWNLASGGSGALTEMVAKAIPYFAPDSTELFASGGDGDCARWKIQGGTNASSPPELIRLPLRKPNNFVSICIASNWMVITATNGSRVVPLAHLDADADWNRTASGLNLASPDGRWLAICSPFSPYLYIYSLPGLEPVTEITAAGNIGEFRFSPAGDELAVLARGMVAFWGTANWQRTPVVTNAVGLLYSPDAHTCWLAEDYRSAALRDRRTFEKLLPLPAGTRPLALSADGRFLAVSVDLRRLQVWDLVETRSQLRELGLDWK